MLTIHDINPNKQRAFIVTRKAPKNWQDVFQNISRLHAENFTTQDVRLQLEKLGMNLKPNSLQVKLARYTSKGILNKARRNQFRISPKGLIFFNILTEQNKESSHD